MSNETVESVMEPVEQVPVKENMILGILGALIGAALGGASIIGLSQLGYIASLSGFILAFCTLKGYELLAKKLSTKGIVVCVILMLVTPFVADWLDWGILLYREFSQYYEVTYFDCLQILPEFFADGTIEMGEYLKNLGMIYLFVIMGGYYTLKNAFKNK